MDENERIYIAPKRGRLPRRYEFIGEPHPMMRNGRPLIAVLAIGAFLWWLIWRVSH